MPETDKPPNRIKRFFSNPIVGGLGTIIGLISILLAIYFYLDQKEFRKLTYNVHPVRAAIVKAGQVSQLTALYANKPITTDITAAQIAIWNQGKLPIKSTNILQPIILSTAGKTPILEVSIRKVSRDVIKLQLKEDETQSGRATLSWQILEQNDGGIIQLIYAGSPDVEIRVDGVIEGQKEIERVDFYRKIISAQDSYVGALRDMEALGEMSLMFALLTAALSILFISIGRIRILARFRPIPDFAKWWFTGCTIFLLLLFAFTVFSRSKGMGPPFGF